MPKKKKTWIDKRTADTYLVIHRNRKFPQDILEQQRGQLPNKKKDYEEHIKCGIYFDDDYDYMQHLRDLDEIVFLEKAEEVKVPEYCNNSNREPEYSFPKEKLEPNDGSLDAEEHFDSEIEAALEGNFDFDNPENQLDDDFVLCANNVAISSNCLGDSLLNHRSRSQSFSEEDENDINSFEANEIEMQDSCEDELMKDLSLERCDRLEQRMIDEKFEHLCNEYEDDKSSEVDYEEEIDTLIDPNSGRIKELVEERKRERTELVLHNDEVARKFANELEDEDEDQLEDITVECSGPKKAKWDCESVLSTYSNLYNRPCLIKEPSFKRKIKRFLKEAEADYEMEEVKSVTASVSRPKGETAEERRIRKALVKEQRRERRIEKKCNKLAFKEEKRRMQVQRNGDDVKMTLLV